MTAAPAPLAATTPFAALRGAAIPDGAAAGALADFSAGVAAPPAPDSFGAALLAQAAVRTEPYSAAGGREDREDPPPDSALAFVLPELFPLRADPPTGTVPAQAFLAGSSEPVAADALREITGVAPESKAALHNPPPADVKPAPPGGNDAAQASSAPGAAGDRTPVELHAATSAEPAPRTIELQRVAGDNPAAAPVREPHDHRRLVMTIAQVERNGQSRLEIRLDPPELGAVSIDIITDADGAVRALVTAEKAETLLLARRHIDTLERELARAGETPASIEFRQDDSPGRGRDETHADDRRHSPHTPYNAQDGFDAAFETMLSDTRYSVLA